MSWAATAIIGASAIGGLSTAYAANKASKAQQAATKQAADTAMGQYQQTRADLAPFRQIGQDASKQLTEQLPFLTSPIVMDQNALEQTPGYQFTKYQGLKSVQNSAAARGLGTSGAALKGAATFATGLADQTYQTQFNLENTNRTNAYNRLKGLIDTGTTAGAQTGIIGANAANTAAGAQISGGNAAAAGINQIGQAGVNVANTVGGYAMYKGLYDNNNDPTMNINPGNAGGTGGWA